MACWQTLLSFLLLSRSNVWFQSGHGPEMMSSSTPCHSTMCMASLTSSCALSGWAPHASCFLSSSLRRLKMSLLSFCYPSWDKESLTFRRLWVWPANSTVRCMLCFRYRGWMWTRSSVRVSPLLSFSSPLFSSLSDCHTKCLGLSDELPCVALYLTNADSRWGLKQQINRWADIEGW